MSTFSNNLNIIDDGVKSLLKEKDLYHDMQAVVAGTQFQDPKFNKSHLWKVKDYVHYYKNDWANDDPLTPEKDVRWRCRLAAPFRSINKAIIACRECGRLDLLDPIIEALDANGIHITIDAKQNVQDFSNVIDAMDNIQTEICNHADERRDARDQAASMKQLTKASYNNTVRSILNVEKERLKVNGDLTMAMENSNEKLQDLVVDASMEVDMYTHAQNYVKNGVVD